MKYGRRGQQTGYQAHAHTLLYDVHRLLCRLCDFIAWMGLKSRHEIDCCPSADRCSGPAETSQLSLLSISSLLSLSLSLSLLSPLSTHPLPVTPSGTAVPPGGRTRPVAVTSASVPPPPPPPWSRWLRPTPPSRRRWRTPTSPPPPPSPSRTCPPMVGSFGWLCGWYGCGAVDLWLRLRLWLVEVVVEVGERGGGGGGRRRTDSQVVVVGRCVTVVGRWWVVV